MVKITVATETTGAITLPAIAPTVFQGRPSLSRAQTRATQTNTVGLGFNHSFASSPHF